MVVVRAKAERRGNVRVRSALWRTEDQPVWLKVFLG